MRTLHRCGLALFSDSRWKILANATHGDFTVTAIGICMACEGSTMAWGFMLATGRLRGRGGRSTLSWRSAYTAR